MKRKWGIPVVTLVLFITFCILFSIISLWISSLLKSRYPNTRCDLILDCILLAIGLGVVSYQLKEQYWTYISMVFVTTLTLLWVCITFVAHFLSRLFTEKTQKGLSERND